MVTVGTLDVVDDVRPARWLTQSVRTFAENIGSLVPANFEAYARVFHPACSGGDPVRWAEVARANGAIAHPEMQFTRLLGYPSRYDPGYRARQPDVFDEAPSVGALPPDVAASLARTLARHTSTAGRCWFAVWEGWGALDPAFRHRPTFALPSRNYHLARGPLAAASRSVGAQPFGHVSANLWWPDDHAWCVATEIDFASTYLGASAAAIEELLTNTELEVAQLSVTAGVTADSDVLNAAVDSDEPRA